MGFPTGIYAPRTKSNKVGVIYTPLVPTTLFAEDISLLDAEVVAIENLLQPKAAAIGSLLGSNTGDQDLSVLVPKSLYDAHTILQATSDNTPVALTVGEQTIVGRKTGGAITALTAAEVKTLIAVAQADVTGLTTANAPYFAGAHFTDHVGIAKGKFLQISDQSAGDGDTMLRFFMERAWSFKIGGSGASTSLVLQTETDYKFFKIRNGYGDDVLSVLACRPLTTAQIDCYGILVARDVLQCIKKITYYNNVATEGYGVPAIVDLVELTAQSASISNTNFTSAGTAGLYRITYYLRTTTSQAGAASANLTLTYNDGDAITTGTLASCNLQTTTYATTNQGTIFVYLASGSVQYAVTAAGIALGRYAIRMICERVN